MSSRGIYSDLVTKRISAAEWAQSQRDGLSEKEFQAQVVSLARTLGWMTYHTFNSQRSNPGFPDLVMVRGERVVFAELKSEKGRVSEAQKEWLAALNVLADVPGSPVKVWMWRPSDWDDIVQTLAR